MKKKLLTALTITAICTVFIIAIRVFTPLLVTTAGSITDDDPYSNIVSQMSNDEIDEVINIIEKDPEIKAILDEGAVISNLSNHLLAMEPVKIGEGPGELSEKRVWVGIDLGNKHYYADVDVIREKILWFGDEKP